MPNHGCLKPLLSNKIMGVFKLLSNFSHGCLSNFSNFWCLSNFFSQTSPERAEPETRTPGAMTPRARKQGAKHPGQGASRHHLAPLTQPPGVRHREAATMKGNGRAWLGRWERSEPIFRLRSFVISAVLAAGLSGVRRLPARVFAFVGRQRALSDAGTWQPAPKPRAGDRVLTPRTPG